MNLINKEDLDNILPAHREVLETLAETIESMANYDKAESYEEFLGMKLVRKIYKEILRKSKAKFEEIDNKGR